jgi:hypothetical protein
MASGAGGSAGSSAAPKQPKRREVGTSIEIRHAFGSQCHKNTLLDANQINFLDPSFIIAPVGRHIS